MAALARAFPAVLPLAVLCLRFVAMPRRSEGWDLGLLLFALGYSVAAALASRSPRLRARIALAGWSALLTVGVVLGIRGVLRTWIAPKVDWRSEAAALRDAPWNAEYWREYQESYRAQWRPYVYWRRQAYDGHWIHVDAEGRRRTWNARDEAEADTRIWMFGGSTLWGTGSPDDQTIASGVARGLTDRGFSVHVTNWGESGWVSTQSLIQLLLRLRAGERPDLVIFYDGVNDFFAAAQLREAGLPQNEDNRRLEFARNPGIPVSDVAPEVTGRREPDDAALAREVVDAWLGNIEQVRALGAREGFSVLALWQPVALLDKPLTDDERASLDRLDAGARRLIEDHYGVLRGRLPLPDVADLSAVLDGRTEPLYLDFCHLAPQGNAIVASRIVDLVAGLLGR